MGILDAFRRWLYVADHPAVRAEYTRTSGDLLINDPAQFVWMGLDTGGGAWPIGPNGPHSRYWPGGTAPAVPAVLRATSLITGPLTAAPFRVLDSGRPVSVPRWLTDPMLLRPVGERVHPEVNQLGRAAFWSAWIRNAAWWGEAGILFNETAGGQPVAGTLRHVAPGALSTERNDDGALVWVMGEGAERLAFDRDGYATLGPVRYRLLVLRNPHSPVDHMGRSKGAFALAPSVFGLAEQVESYAHGQFRAGVPNGYLKVSAPDLQQAEADALKAKWMEAHGGDRRSIAVLNSVTDFQAINLSPVDAALAEVKRLNIADVAFAFGLDPGTLGAGLQNSATYSNIRDNWSNHRDFGLAPWIAAVQDTLSALLPGSSAVAVNLDGFANPAPGERYAAYATALDKGILELDEVRALEGLPPLGRPRLEPVEQEEPEEPGEEEAA